MMGRLLEEFPPVATAAWEEAIAKDLKDTRDAEKLTWRSPEGISVKAYYRAEDTAGLAFADPARLDAAKVGVLLGGRLSAAIGGAVLWRTLPRTS